LKKFDSHSGGANYDAIDDLAV